jgi:hypothetical protein
LRRLYRFMSGRWFVASREELKAQGFTESRVKNWLKSGRLIKLFRAVYSYGRDVESREAVRRAALLAVGPDSVLIGRSACEAWGIVEAGPGLPRLVEVGSPVGQTRVLAGKSPALRGTRVKVKSRNYRAEDVRENDGVRLMRPVVALVDFASGATEREVRFAFLEACRLKLFDERDLKYFFTNLARRRGARKLRPFLALWVPELRRIRSVFEGWFLLEWKARGYPMPQVNVEVHGYEVDCYWPACGIVLELDGDAFHGDPAQKELDRQKQRALEANGLTVLRATFKEFETRMNAVLDHVASEVGAI